MHASHESRSCLSAWAQALTLSLTGSGAARLPCHSMHPWEVRRMTFIDVVGAAAAEVTPPPAVATPPPMATSTTCPPRCKCVGQRGRHPSNGSFVSRTRWILQWCRALRVPTSCWLRQAGAKPSWALMVFGALVAWRAPRFLPAGQQGLPSDAGPSSRRAASRFAAGSLGDTPRPAPTGRLFCCSWVFRWVPLVVAWSARPVWMNSNSFSVKWRTGGANEHQPGA